jgi:hypothetical protein
MPDRKSVGIEKVWRDSMFKDSPAQRISTTFLIGMARAPRCIKASHVDQVCIFKRVRLFCGIVRLVGFSGRADNSAGPIWIPLHRSLRSSGALVFADVNLEHCCKMQFSKFNTSRFAEGKWDGRRSGELLNFF